jgi:hypothetical protein
LLKAEPMAPALGGAEAIGSARATKRGNVRYWAIETSPGWLLVDEAAVTQDVVRIVGQSTVEALCLFTSRLSVDAFMEEFFPEESFDTRQELEKAFRDELDGAVRPLAEPYLGFPSFTPQELAQVVKSMSAEVRYVAVNPDTSRQEVWDAGQFEAYLSSLAD